jgi:probable addiction module antidote protein
MSKATAFNPAKYRNNPKLIAKYLTDALASGDAAFTTRAIGNLARAHGMGPLPKRRT